MPPTPITRSLGEHDGLLLHGPSGLRRDETAGRLLNNLSMKTANNSAKASLATNPATTSLDTAVVVTARFKIYTSLIYCCSSNCTHSFGEHSRRRTRCDRPSIASAVFRHHQSITTTEENSHHLRRLLANLYRRKY